MGDFNTNLGSGSGSSSLKDQFERFCVTHDLSQLISDYTRISIHSKSLLDLAIVSDPDRIAESGVIDLGVSDHCMVYCSRKFVRQKFGFHKEARIRSRKQYSKEEFTTRLNNLNWSSVTSCNDVNNAWCTFKTLFLSVLDSLCPFKNVRIKQNTAPWCTDDILEMIRKRDRLLSDFRKDGSPSTYSEFRRVRNQTQRLVDKAKQSYFREKLELEKDDPKKLWKTLKSFGCNNKSQSSNSNIGLTNGNDVEFDQCKVAHMFNNFFTTVATSLVEELPPCPGRFPTAEVEELYLDKGVIPDNFNFSEVSVDQVLKLLMSVSPNKATGLDSIPATFVKDAAEIIASPLAYIINLSLSCGIFPDDLKCARVVPIFKKGSKTDVSNYRPVSILSVISKIWERVVYDQLYCYLNDFNLLYRFQSGFRQSYSTDSCIIHLTDYIRSEIDKGKYVGMVLLDLRKAFDTVKHDILINKLSAVGLSRASCSWFESYLSNRSQLVELRGEKSSLEGITCGVPQGSILGPLLFLLYVNDLQLAVGCRLMLYADDSALLYSGSSIDEIESVLSDNLNSVSDWLVDNRLSLHLGKTESILFGKKSKINSGRDLDVLCNDTRINSKKCVSYLGTELDCSLSGEPMAEKVLKKVNGRLKFLYRKTKFLDFSSRKLLASALVKCNFDYACSFWFSGLSKRSKSKLQISLNKLIRFVLNLSPRSHISADHYRCLGWLPLEKRVEQLKLNHIYKILNGSAPSFLSENLLLSSRRHNHNTRSSQKSFVIPHHGSHTQHSFCITAAKLWNSLPVEIVNASQSLSSFKTNVKRFLMEGLVAEEEAAFIFY